MTKRSKSAGKPAPAKLPNYWDYIRVEELLALQGGLEEREEGLSNDEVLFITVHQVFELWFKLMLRELRSMRDLFGQELVQERELSSAVAGLKRVVTILRRCVDHFEVVETLQTRNYLAFRDKLTPASGFQSAQLRQIEIVLGLDEAQRVHRLRFDPNEIQISTLLSIKTGGCPEDCSYCPQSSHYDTDVKAS
ncbi:MAG: tryptophan 2,3-dioxygenase family protein, partial [Planctomycetota bacterium]